MTGGGSMNAFDFTIRTKADLLRAVDSFGFLPFFAGSVPGFSIEEHTAADAWYSSGSGEWKVWDWKGPVIREAGCAYGKFFENRAAFISREWFPDFANLRRDGYDFDARYDEGLAAYRDRELYELLDANAPVTSQALKSEGNYRKGGKKGFDTVITRLQAQCYVVISGFTYARDRTGREYGWGVAEYSTPEKLFGADFTDRVYARSPEESRERVYKHLRALLPHAGEELVRRLLK